MLAVGKRFITGNIRPETLSRLTVPINVLLIVLLAHELARLSWSLLPPPAVAPISIREPTSSPAIMANASASKRNYAVISDWHLFGQIQATQPKPSPVITAPETKLNLRLGGIFHTHGDGRALALIAEGSGEENSYTVGAQLPGGARLEQILRDRVVLSRNGRLETLSLPQETEGVETIFSNSQEIHSLNETETITIDASDIVSRFRDAVATQPETLQDLALVDPYIQNGQFLGFRLRPGRDRRLLQQLGLRRGDVITEVNGTRLSDPTTGVALLQQLANTDQFTVQVLRNGNEIPFIFYANAR